MSYKDARGLFGPPNTRAVYMERHGEPVYEDEEYAVWATDDTEWDAVVIQKDGLGYGLPCSAGRGSYHEGINRLARAVKGLGISIDGREVDQ